MAKQLEFRNQIHGTEAVAVAQPEVHNGRLIYRLSRRQVKRIRHQLCPGRDYCACKMHALYARGRQLRPYIASVLLSGAVDVEFTE